ncbi:hypothetical protein SRHO_G00312440 [Serrasalmus rhombeus]
MREQQCCGHAPYKPWSTECEARGKHKRVRVSEREAETLKPADESERPPSFGLCALPPDPLDTEPQLAFPSTRPFRSLLTSIYLSILYSDPTALLRATLALNPEANPNSSNAPETNTSSAHTPETNTSFSHASETNFSCSDGPTENPSSSVAPLHTEPTYTLILTPVTSEKENSTVVLNLEVNPSSSDDPETSPICSDAPETSPFSSDGPEASPSFSAPPEPRSSSLDELNPILSPVTSGNENSTDKYPCKKRTQEVTPNECPVHTMADTYPVQKILSQRVSKEGTKEVKVRWQQCSGCGIKWKDTWEPFNEIFP